MRDLLKFAILLTMALATTSATASMLQARAIARSMKTTELGERALLFAHPWVCKASEGQSCTAPATFTY